MFLFLISSQVIHELNFSSKYYHHLILTRVH